MEEQRKIPEPTETQIEEWQAQYGKGNVIRLEAELDPNDDDLGINPTLVVYARKPNPQHLARFAASAQKDAYKALRDLIFDTRLWPDAEAVKAEFERLPGLVIGLGTQLNGVMGTNVSFTVKRF
ncbi:MAG: hypothetical protein ACOY94_19585 [Bacillota bacterium]